MSREERRRSENRGAAAFVGSGGAPTLSDLFAAAIAQHRSGGLAEAERGYRHILTLSPDHADSLHGLGLIALQRGDAKGAADLIGQAVAINDRVADYHFNLAGAYRTLKRMDKVTAHLERTIELRGDHAFAHLNLGNVYREQGGSEEALACFRRALALQPNLPAAHFNIAGLLFERGQAAEAAASYRQAAALAPRHAETRHRLAIALATQGKIGEAVPHFEQAVALKPELAAGPDLAMAYIFSGQPERAFDAARRALDLSPTEVNKALFAHCAQFVRFTADDGSCRKLLLRAVTEGWGRPRDLAGVCINIIKLDPAISDAIARCDAVWPELIAADALDASLFAALAQDELFCRLLESDPATDVGLERLLTNVRCVLLTAAAENKFSENLLDFCCAVARQCFVNEYVFAATQAETAQIESLQASIEAALAGGDPILPHQLAAVASYQPLHTLAQAELLLQRSWPKPVEAVAAQQIGQPLEERKLAAVIPMLTAIGSDVSIAVRRQYEENPYPRWTKPAPAKQAAGLGVPQPAHGSEGLFAGCGTGLAAIELAQQAPQARFLAIDLSRASLAYAKRMAASLSVSNIEFAQADILNLGSIGRTFDFIDSSGVLHHLADPWEGWRVLLSVLRPGGSMQIGLYSKAARGNVNAARALIAQRGFQPVSDDIRRCRQELLASSDPLLRSIVQWKDFFTTSECRDLIFHVQEHQVSIPEIKAFLAENDLRFGGFIVAASTRQSFERRFPGTALGDLDCWHTFETEDPDAFAAMYLFSVHKPAAPSHGSG